jgi:DNA (cytosine-5)-methyltransferase 1
MDGEHLQHSEKMPMLHTFGSLFAGVGGFDIGFERAGWECRFQVEWDKHCRTVLDQHWPNVPKWGDVSTVSGYELPPVDCIIFGSPCQDLSVAGKRAGLEGARSGLFFEAVRIIKEMRDATGGTFPRWTVWENVAGALSSNQGRDFGAVVGEMVETGAVLQEYALLDAQHFGVPQRRRRVFLISVFDPAIASRCPDPLLPVTKSVRGYSAKGRQKAEDYSSTYAFDTQFGSNANVFVDIAPPLKASQQPPSVIHNDKARRLTPLECERLMGWPDNWTEGQADTHRYKQCGNGVASPVAQRIAQHMRRINEIQ